jgi:transposase
MAIKRHKRNGRVYLAEYKSERIDGKVKSTYVRYIGVEGEPKIPPRKNKRPNNEINFSRTSLSGDVSVLWHLSQEIGISTTIDRFTLSNTDITNITPGKMLTIWAINRVIDPESTTQLSEWVRCTDLPLLSAIKPEFFTKDAFLESLDFICYYNSSLGKIEDISSSIEDELYHYWREKHPLPCEQSEILAYDMTAVLFHGKSCPISQLGYNSEHIRRNQINLAILVSKFDRYPISHSVYSGERTSITTVNNLFSRLNDLSIEPGILIWDRGNVSNQSIQIVEQNNWKIICGLPKSSKVVQKILLNTPIPSTPLSKVKNSVCGYIYAKKIRARVFGKERSITVYSNMNTGIRDTEERNGALQSVSQKLDVILKNSEKYTEKQLNGQLTKLLKSNFRFFTSMVN